MDPQEEIARLKGRLDAYEKAFSALSEKLRMPSPSQHLRPSAGSDDLSNVRNAFTKWLQTFERAREHRIYQGLGDPQFKSGFADAVKELRDQFSDRVARR